MPNVSQETLKRIQEVYTPDLSVAQIARLVGKSPTAVRRAFQMLNLPPCRFRPVPQNIPPLDPIWAAEFRGFFWGEGSAGLTYQANGNTRPQLAISLRADDKDIIDDICNHLGGKPYYQHGHSRIKNAKPQCIWRVSGWSRARAIIEATDLAGGLMPAKKRQDIALLYEACLVRWKMPHRLVSEEHKQILLSYHKAIIEARQYR